MSTLQLCDNDDNLIANSTKNISVCLRPRMYYIVVGSSGADQYMLQAVTNITRYLIVKMLLPILPIILYYSCQ